MKHFLLLFLLATPLASQSVVITAIPNHGKEFKLTMDDHDPIGSLYKCRARIIKRHWWSRANGSGVCMIPPGSIHAGRNTVLHFPDRRVVVDVRR